MCEFDKIEAEFVETVQRFFPPEQNNSISSGHSRINDFVTIVSAVVSIYDVNFSHYDQPALLDEIVGTIIENSDKKIVIEGKFQGRDCQVTILL